MNRASIETTFHQIFCDDMQIEKHNEGYLVRLPYTDYLGTSVEALVTLRGKEIYIDDMGHTAGLLFELSQSGENSLGFQLVKKISDVNSVRLDYNEGVLITSGYINDIKTPVLNFFKTLISLQNILPHLQTRKRETLGRRSLRARLSRDIVQLKLPATAVQKLTEVSGKYENWPVDYKYYRGENGSKTEVILVTASLALKDPRQKAEHILTLAHDVLETKEQRTLRIIYDFDGNHKSESAKRAAGLIQHYQKIIGYRVFDYSNRDDRMELSSTTAQELASFSLLKQ
jgi:hypothetical protein